MNILVSPLLTVLTTLSTTVTGESASNCPSGLPTELHFDCSVAESAARSGEDGPGDFGSHYYNVTEKLQAWVDRQMQLEVAREEAASATTDVSQQSNEP